MPRRKITNRNIRNLQKNQSTYSVSIPVEFIRELEWQDRQKVTIRKTGKKLIIEDWEE